MLPIPFQAISKSNVELREYQAGERVFAMGDQTHSIFHVIFGGVTLQRYSKSGDLITIHRAFSNEYFAEASLFADAYHCDAITIEKSQIAAISKTSIVDLMRVDQEFSKMLTAYFARQVQDYRRLIELRSIRSAKDRVLAGLYEGLHRGNIMSFASCLGLSHEATYRALKELVKTGHVIKEGRGHYRLNK